MPNLKELADDLNAALPTIETAIRAGVAIFDPAAEGAAEFALALAKIGAAGASELEAIKAQAPNVDPATWDAIADHNIADDAAIMALKG